MECLRNLSPPRQGRRATAHEAQTGNRHIAHSTYFWDAVKPFTELLVSEIIATFPNASTGVYRALHHGGTEVVAGTQGRTDACPLR
jgi:hypothetical protein